MYSKKFLIKVKQSIHFLFNWAFASFFIYKNWWLMYFDYFLPFYVNEHILITRKSGSYYIRAKEGDVSIANEILLQKEYSDSKPEYNNAGLSIIIDIGAHIGLFALTNFKKNSNQKIYCYEPDPDNFIQLVKNIKLNSAEKNIFPILAAIGDKACKTILRKSEKSGGGTINSELDMDSLGGFTNNIEVDVRTLSSEINRLNLKHINVVKIDCEGMEYSIINTLSKELFGKIDRMFIECHPLKNLDMKEVRRALKENLSSNGYSTYIRKQISYVDVVLLEATKK